MTNTKPTAPPEELRNAWARVFAHAWRNEKLLRKLNKDPRKTIRHLAGIEKDEQWAGDLVAPESIQLLTEASNTIHLYVEDENSEEGYLALPPLPDSLKGNLSEDQLYQYASQDGLYGLLRVC